MGGRYQSCRYQYKVAPSALVPETGVIANGSWGLIGQLAARATGVEMGMNLWNEPGMCYMEQMLS